MKKIIVENGKIYICKQITANCEKPYTKTSLTIDVDKLITALQRRMENCIKELQEAYNHKTIVETSEYTITYIGGYFHIPSYNTMEETIDILQHIIDVKETTFIDIEDLKILTWMQLNQLKKAIVAFDKDWTKLASTIEDIEMFKLNTITEI